MPDPDSKKEKIELFYYYLRLKIQKSAHQRSHTFNSASRRLLLLWQKSYFSDDFNHLALVGTCI